ncbi:MAG: restriction endonuclease subunit S [Rhodocyclaceae bacterium]|nr:restriction endonuclease subunit S [Rhodocyclaceae bacterium]MCA3076727.1 restriction endonuclease subunit S [Rhodocyclaceae bacterium]MCA3090370.1 restriction endonuclease subunit S [Rhodocyclaceae bacterium]MCA3096005.1 restriction endonuclease subunit S [Rhodocyclaceae bacterium]MCA3099890.1 restriction endonuclease subunit S [Rhodocyclaceae bacterium]
MLPDGWRRSTLGEIARITSGGTPDRSEASYWGGSVPWVTTGEIQFNTITDTVEKITEAGLKNSSAKRFPPGTLLMAMYGQGKTRGQVAKLGVEAATNQACAAILLHEGHDADFYFQYLSAHYESIRELGNAGTQQNLSGGILKTVEVPVPPIEVQRRIAHVVGVWDEAIIKAEKIVSASQKRNRSLTTSLLSGRRRLATRSSRWTYLDFDEVFERVARKNTTGNDNVLTISGEHGLISQREYFNKSVASADLSGYTLLHRGEFAYNKSYSAGYPMGAIKPLMTYDAGVVSSLYLCFRLRPSANARFDFFRHYFEGGMLNEGIGGIAQEGARNHGLLNVGIGDFFKLRLHVPGAEEQGAIATVINTAKAEERLQLRRLNALRSEKQALMQQLLTGKRRVSVSDGDSTP